MSALDLVELLFKKGLIAEKVRKKLLSQIEGASKTVSPKSIGKALVKKGLLTSDQIAAAIAELEEGASETRDDLAILEPLEEERPVEVVDAVDMDDELGLADDESLAEPIDESVEAVEPVAEISDVSPNVETLDDALDEHEEHHDDAVAPPSTPGKRGRKKFRTNRWDSPLMLAGGGGLILMIALGGVLWFLMTRETSQQAFNAAEEAYRSASYGQAAAQYTKFINKFSKDENVSSAKVKLRLCSIWTDVTAKNWESALTKVQNDLPTIEAEVAFDEARGELASILPNIMDGFATAADSAANSEDAQRNLDLANAALKEINNSSYLPTRFRKDLQPKIDSIEGIMKTVERNINRDKELNNAVAKINSAVEAGNTREAYETRRELLNKYPLLHDNEKLAATIGSITEKERGKVIPITTPPEAVAGDRAVASDIRVTLAARKGNTIEQLAGQIAYVQTRGSVYAINANDGSVAWRRFVGFEADVAPLSLGQSFNSDVIAVDSRVNELVRLAAADGKAQWRVPCDGQFTSPVSFESRLFVTCSHDQTGRLLVVDPNSGQTTGGVEFPMAISCSPLITRSGQIIQPGDHSSVFVLNSQDMQCTDVAYIGHGAGTIVVPPIEVLDYIVVAENPASNFSLLHVLKRNPEDGKLIETTKPVRLEGRIVVPMTSDGKNFVVSTDRGEVEVFEFRNNQDTPEKAVSPGVTAMGETSTGYVHFADGRLWVGNTQFARYDVQLARKALARKWIRNKGDRYIAPFQQFGNVLIAVRQPEGRRGATVTALQIAGNADDGNVLWEVDLGVQPAGNVFIHDKALNVVTANTDLFRLGRSELQQPVINEASARIPSAKLPVVTESLDMGNGVRVFLSEQAPSKIVVFDSSAPNAMSLVDLQLGGDQPAALPVSYKGALVVPAVSGAVYYVDPKTGTPVANEFQPSLTSNQEAKWPRPVVIGDELFMPDGAGQVYRVALNSNPQPHLASVAQANSDFLPRGNMAVLGNIVYGVQRAVAGDEIVSVNAADLNAATKRWDLGGRVAWGPASVGQFVFVTSDSGEMICFDGGQNEVWRTKLQHGPIAGEPLVLGDQLVVTSISGIVSKLSIASGEETSQFDVGEPLGSGAVQFGERSIALGSDGTLHVFRLQ
ncbi:MAG: PQQ-binding-like beta-propeller repeat protein [Planctomycetales bacterium]|nr:PQQ-binding-like beta-propeller repeat protein [Planctomycetales bacterium]